MLTLPVMMLAWIPFRAESLSNTFSMWSKVVDPFAYDALGMRENVYLSAAFIMFSFFVVYWAKNKLLPLIANKSGVIVVFGETIAFSVMIPLVIIFFRPINQFIYFQF